MRRLSVFICAALVASCLTGCGGSGPGRSARATQTRRDPQTAGALLVIATRFNANYSANRDGAVYDRWDARSRRIITRARYIRLHRECPTAPGPATVQGVERAGRWWLVHYSISGVELTDYWRYTHGRWEFDLIRSNPDAAQLYRLPAARYLAAVGCQPSR